MHWLHFIGRSYYTEAQFTREAKAVGVTRVIARKTLERMTFGDVVHLAINDGKSAVMFGKFVVSGLSGFSAEEGALLRERYTLKCVDTGGQMVKRGCGSYMTGPAFAAEELPSIAEILATIATARDKGKLMVSGAFVGVERVRLKSMRHHLGFRPFSFAKYVVAVANASARGKTKAVKGFFYVGKGEPLSNVVDIDAARLQTVHGYRRK